MPRLSHQLLAKAWKENPLLPLLLRPCRDLQSARRELQWLTEHAITSRPGEKEDWRRLLHKICHERSRGKPLQYILGSEYFGPLEIKCQPGVLIPRQETAASVTYLMERIGSIHSLRFSSEGLKVLDLCTGTGCIPLLLARTFPFATLGVDRLDLLGVDISRTAVKLARQNQRIAQEQYVDHIVDRVDDPSADNFEVDRRRDALTKANFIQADILSKPEDPDWFLKDVAESKNDPIDLWTALHREGHGPKWDILISNPPYISPKHFYTTTTRSVRNFEPKLALVPPLMTPYLTDEQQGDLFYPRLLQLADRFQSSILLMEVADLVQAERVSALAFKGRKWSGVEIWCDEPGLPSDPHRKSRLCDVPILGQGNGRSVFCWRKS